MAKILHVQASPRGWQSASYRVAKAFVDEYGKAHPDTGVEMLPLFSMHIPEFMAPEAAAKYMVLEGVEPVDHAAKAWAAVIEVINKFKTGDLYVISSAMWNFSIPYRLKQYIDLIVQPGLTFSFTPGAGYKGLVTGRPAVLILARGGDYPQGGPGVSFDMQRPYLEMILKFIGFTDIRSIIIEPTLAGSDVMEQKVAQACEQARALAKTM